MLFLKLVRESFIFAITALRVNKLRTILSLLGISIGIFTIITVFTIVDSLEKNLRTSVEKLGNNVIYIQKWPWVFGGDYPWWKYFNRPTPSMKDFYELEKRIDNAEAIAFCIFIENRVVKFKTNSVENVTLISASHDYNKVRALEFEKGRYFSQNESRSGKNYAVIGSAVAEALFGSREPIGQDIKIQGRKLTVIGVVKKEGEDILDTSADNAVFVPINYVRNLIDIRNERYGPMIMVKGVEGVTLSEMDNELKGAMRSIRRLSPREEDDFALNQSSLISKQISSIFGVVDFAGWVIGGFSILVGGFGIANIMFVSVKERTHIIGIQKSLGAKNYFILLQFLVEAVILSIFGGAIGLMVVYLETLLASSAFDFELSLSLSNIVLGIVVSAVIGLFSGFMPAFSAARLDPVEALRAK